MVDVDKAIVAKIDKKGKHFEVLVDCENAVEFKKGNASLDDALVTEEIFEDVKKGKRASEHDLEEVFNSKNPREVAEKIIKESKLELTTEYKNKLREEKRKQIINLIHRNSIDPKNNIPHPPQRIENAIEEAGVKIDENKSAEEQVKDIIDKIKSIIPIKYEIKKLKIKIPAQYSAKSYPILKQFGKIIKDNWLSDGSFEATIEVPAGMQESLFDKLNNLTHGDIESEEVK